MYTQVILFILAAILIIFLHFKIKNPTNLEQEHKESKRYIIPWAWLFSYVISSYCRCDYMDFRSTTTKSKYSTNNGSKTTPIFIILISVVGPILEEYVFRKCSLVNYMIELKEIESLPS